MRLNFYAPCDVCGQPSSDVGPFFRRRRDGWLQYSLCRKHVPRIRLFVWERGMRLGKWAVLLFPDVAGLMTCAKCDTPARVVPFHRTPYSEGNSVSALCEVCWHELTPEQRMPYYAELMDLWREQGADQAHIDQVLAAVERGL